jgi:hypothetical protein
VKTPSSPSARTRTLTTLGGSPSLLGINCPRCLLLQSLHAEFILYAATKIIIIPLLVGPVLAQPKWMDVARPRLKKIQKKFKKTFKKICDFIKYFSTHFA